MAATAEREIFTPYFTWIRWMIKEKSPLTKFSLIFFMKTASFMSINVYICSNLFVRIVLITNFPNDLQ